MSEPKDIFSKQAGLYAAFRPRYPVELYEYILPLLCGRDGAWDAGTGNGQVAGVLSGYFGHVWGTDISSAQLGLTHRADNITYLLAPAEDSGLPDRSCDLITVAQALHWFDAERFYREVRRVARPGAVIAVWGYNLLRVSPELDTHIDRFYRDVVGSCWEPERRHITSEYATIHFDFDDKQLKHFEMRFDWGLPDLEGYLGSWSAVQKFISIHNYDPVPVFISEITHLWGENQKLTVVFPLFLRTGIVRSDLLT